MSLWDILWLLCFGFFFIACLMLVFNITTDLFRDRERNGWLKALWIAALPPAPLVAG